MGECKFQSRKSLKPCTPSAVCCTGGCEKVCRTPPSLAPGLLGHSENGVCPSLTPRVRKTFFPSPNFEEIYQLGVHGSFHSHTNSAYESKVRQTIMYTLVHGSKHAMVMQCRGGDHITGTADLSGQPALPPAERNKRKVPLDFQDSISKFSKRTSSRFNHLGYLYLLPLSPKLPVPSRENRHPS